MPTAESIRDANVRYHDLAASHYDSKWGINYDELGQAQVTGKLRKALGHEPPRFGRALEIGAGTGYFTLNLLRAGVIGQAVATDISPGMLRALESSAARAGRAGGDRGLRGLRAALRATTSSISSSDTRCSTTFRTSTRPSESSAACCARAAWWRSAASPRAMATGWPRSPSAGRWRSRPSGAALMGAGPRGHANGDGAVLWSEEDVLEQEVDVHAFTPAALAAHAEGAGFTDVRISGEELAASLFGWANRTLEATAEPDDIPWAWRVYAHRGYLLLQRVDRSLLEPRLPAALFYNLLVSGTAR